MNILGISALDTDATAALVQGERIALSAGEERFSRVKQHAGFPHKSVEDILKRSNLSPADIDVVAYPFYPWYREASLISKGFLLNAAYNVCQKDFLRSKFYHFAYYVRFCMEAFKTHKRYHKDLMQSLKRLGLDRKLTRMEHHLAHAASAFYTSGFEDALIITIDAYGSELAGSISIGSPEGIKRIHNIRYPHSMGLFYSQVTEALGFRPARHEGKIVGLAAFGDPAVLFDEIYERFDESDSGYRYISGLNMKYCRELAKEYSREDIASAYQTVLEKVVTNMVAAYVKRYNQRNIVLAGGVTANVKLNQRIFEIDGVENIFIHPNMGDGGTGAGAALYLASELNENMRPYKLRDVYFGPSFTDEEIKEVLDREGLTYQYAKEVEKDIAELISQGKVVARFNGAMEYGPRALGNRSVLYHTKDPSVNDWLNKRLGRTEFMPFAPATLYEYREQCYKNIKGAEYAAKFMTITFDCTDYMKNASPAAVHIDGTARPQLVDEEINPSFYRIIKEYHKLTGIPSIINTSYNMHEEPIVCTPFDAVRAFKLGKL
ncbi:MAG: carbamoyltransferase, partial [Thermodesulfobacteriota bacterium]